MQLARPAVRPTRRLSIVSTVGAAVFAAVAVPGLARADLKVGVVRVTAVTSKIMEAKDVNARLQTDQQYYDAAVKGHQAQIETMKEQLRNLKPDSAQFKTKYAELQDTAVDFNIKDQQRKNQLVQELSDAKRQLFSDIQSAVNDIVKQKGLDLVIVEPEPPIPENPIGVEPQQLDNMFAQKTVLYASPKLDLTEEVVTAMDAAYKKR